MSFWEEMRKKVLDHTTSADLAVDLYSRIEATGVSGISIAKPSYYLSELSVLTWDFMDYIEKLLRTEERSWSRLLQLMMCIRENCRSLLYNVKEISEPLERLITVLEEELEMESAAGEDEGGSPARPTGDGSNDGSGTMGDADVVRESMGESKEGLEEEIRVKFRDSAISESVTNELAECLAEIYLECVQFHKELVRLREVGDDELATVISVLIDVQFGVDIQLRHILMEDFSIDVEPTFTTGIFTRSAHFLAEVSEQLRADRASLLPSGSSAE